MKNELTFLFLFINDTHRKQIVLYYCIIRTLNVDKTLLMELVNNW